MVTINRVTTYVRTDKRIESEASITAADGDTVSASDLELEYISYMKSVTALTDGNVPGAAVVSNPDSRGNNVTLTLYSLTANSDSLVSAGSSNWMLQTVQE